MAIDNARAKPPHSDWSTRFVFWLRNSVWPALTRAGRLSYPKTTGLVVLVILLIWLNLPDFYTPTVIIESVTVPKDMEDAGLTPVVVTDDVRASVLKID